ncbi:MULTISPECIES: HypC/HybG/HupF family hydrogenase formation chaperone [Pseudooceanicola]|nr:MULTISPECIES: HypC/HybG/HupF family hydrogenase formation chaperone [Pseudooceanicola]
MTLPMQVCRIDGLTALCTARETEREVGLILLQDEGLAPGDHVLVHLGQAIRKVSAEEAATTWELLDQILEAGTLPA